MNNGNEYKFEVKLLWQSLIIHFQSAEAGAGATLRASEVKPKFDKFLIKKLGLEKCKEWFIGKGEHPALDYKMRFSQEGNQSVKEPPKIYYGNMGLHESEKVFCLSGDCRMQILCFLPELMKAIKEHVEEFFIVTNFGRMQGKGFGSYIVEGSRTNPEYIGELLARNADASACYGVSGYTPRQSAIFDDIATLYSVMKSGINFKNYHRSYLFEYCHTRNIGNEKAYMKKEHVSPWVDGEPIKHPRNANRHFAEQTDKEYRYVRAMLGVGERIEYITGFEQRTDKFGNLKWMPLRDKDKITINSPEIERCASPITFKIIGGTFYIVANRMPDGIFDKEFVFKNSSSHKSVSLRTPKKTEFDIDDFLAWFVPKYNVDRLKKSDRGEKMSYAINNKIDIVYNGKKGGTD